MKHWASSLVGEVLGLMFSCATREVVCGVRRSWFTGAGALLVDFSRFLRENLVLITTEMSIPVDSTIYPRRGGLLVEPEARLREYWYLGPLDNLQ